MNAQEEDRWAWLKPKDWREVTRKGRDPARRIMRHLEARNAEIDALLAGTEDLQRTIKHEILRADFGAEETVLHQGPGARCLLSTAADAGYPVLRVEGGAEFDFNPAAHEHAYYNLEKVRVTACGTRLVFSYDRTGNDSFRIAAWDTAGGGAAADLAEEAAGNFVLHPEGKGVYYVALDRQHRPSRVVWHPFGKGGARTVYAEKRDRHFLKIYRLGDGRRMAIESDDEKTSIVKLLDMVTGEVATFKARRRNELIKDLRWHAGKIYFRANAGGRFDFSLFRVGKTLKREDWEEVVPCRPGSILLDYRPRADGIALIRAGEYGNGLFLFTRATRAEVPVPVANRPLYALTFAETEEGEVPAVTLSTPVDPPETHAAAPGAALAFAKPLHGHVLRRLFFTAHDGTRVPVTVAYAADTSVDGSAPLFAMAYAAYGRACEVDFHPETPSLTSRGFVYAIIHARGGCEKGHAWHVKGRMFHKKNSCTDFIEGVEFLVREGYGRAGNVAAYGYSAGGIVAGYAANTRPELFRAVFAELPFVDVLNTMKDRTLPLTPMEWEEWGNPLVSRRALNYIRSYCPYQNVKRQAYPHVIATGGLHDTRVMFWEPAKWIESLRAHNTAPTRQLLHTSMEAGHWGHASRRKSAREAARLYTLLLKLMELA